MVMALLLGVVMFIGSLSASPVIEKSDMKVSIEKSITNGDVVAVANDAVSLEVVEADKVEGMINHSASKEFSVNDAAMHLAKGRYWYNLKAKFNYINKRNKNSNYSENYRGWHNPGSNIFQRKV